ncbi:MAG: sialidase family protein [Polyangiaceae bacterium]
MRSHPWTRWTRYASLALSTGAVAALAASAPGCDDPELSVSPSSLDGLTCQSYDFTLSGQSGDVTWSLDPGDEAYGSIDQTGHYTAPIVVPADDLEVVGQADGAEARASVHLSTAHPTKVGSPAVVSHDIQTTTMARAGKVAYTAVLDADNVVRVSRSEDGGATWSSPVQVNDTPSGIVLGCVSVAIDSGDPDVVYVTYQAIQNGGPFATTAGISDQEAGSTVAVAVSEDKGATFTNYVLVSASNEGFCADIASPAADVVVVETPTDDTDDGGEQMKMYTFVDEQRGAGFAAGVTTMYTYTADEVHAPFYMRGLDYVSSDGGDDGAEFPSLFVGPAGQLCVTFWTSTMTIPYDYPLVLMCSTDNGKTFGAPVTVANPTSKDTENGSYYPRHQRGAFSDEGTIAIVWDEPDGQVYVSTSADGQSFDAPVALNHYSANDDGTADAGHHPTVAWEGPVLWIAYQTESLGDGDVTVVDKSCDSGTTWSGNQPANDPAAPRLFPHLLLGDEGMSLSVFDNTENAAVELLTLEP